MGSRIVKSKSLMFQLQEVTVTQGLVVVYVRNTVNFKICLCFSNSVCELLILKLQSPSIIIIVIYRPPSCLDCDFIDVISRAEQYILTILALLNPCWVLFRQHFLSISEETCFLIILSG